MRRSGNLNRLVHGLTNSREGVPGCPFVANFDPGVPGEAEVAMRRILGCDGTAPRAVTQLLVSILAWRHTAAMVEDPDRTWRPDMEKVNFFTTTGDLDLRPDAAGIILFRPQWGTVPVVPDMTLQIVGDKLRVTQGALRAELPCVYGNSAIPDLTSFPGVRFTLVRKNGTPVVDGDSAVVTDVNFAYPYTAVKQRIIDDPVALTVLLEAGVAGFFADAPTDREAVALAAGALADTTLKRTGY